MLKTVLLSLSLILLLTLAYSSQIGPQKSLAITIYGNDFAIVKDTRPIVFDQGVSFLYFTDVSSRIETQTVTFKALDNPEGIKVFQQNYEANVVDAQKIVKKYIEKEVEVFTKRGEYSVRVIGKLLGFGFNSGYILQTRFGVQILNNIQGITLVSLPDGFFTKPTLNWKVFSQEETSTDCEVAYKTQGFSWSADYTIILNADQTKADIGGWVTIDNNSGKKYEDATLKLITGFSDLHMYRVQRLVTLNESSQKQIQFIPKIYDVEIRKYNYISISAGGRQQTNIKASNKIEFNNSEANRLGKPLPAGTFRVFKEDDADNSLEFIGEDRMQHKPKNENITLTTGNAFDIVADKHIIEYTGVDDRGSYKSSQNITIKNHKEFAAEIVVEISNFRGDNLDLFWKSPDVEIVRVNAFLFRISKIFAAGEEKTYVWDQDYRAII